ncbi:MAG: DUF1837 domain-containing protein [Nitrospirae bacterium]|nr:DUF1837 domain-containing protein [Nitrospirota bacterium]
MNVSGAFQPHMMPPGSLPVRCHVLRPDQATILEDYLVQQLPHCYTTIQQIRDRIEETGLSAAEIVANKLPDPGAVMSGDFGEILALYFLSTERPEVTTLIRKWRYKQDRKKSAPLSDIVILHRQNATTISENDYVICAESKQKATPGTFDPISKALEGYTEDNMGRLARTLAWLREKAIDQESRPAIDYITRFTQAGEVPYKKRVLSLPSG